MAFTGIAAIVTATMYWQRHQYLPGQAHMATDLKDTGRPDHPDHTQQLPFSYHSASSLTIPRSNRPSSTGTITCSITALRAKPPAGPVCVGEYPLGAVSDHCGIEHGGLGAKPRISAPGGGNTGSISAGGTLGLMPGERVSPHYSSSGAAHVVGSPTGGFLAGPGYAGVAAAAAAQGGSSSSRLFMVQQLSGRLRPHDGINGGDLMRSGIVMSSPGLSELSLFLDQCQIGETGLGLNG